MLTKEKRATKTVATIKKSVRSGFTLAETIRMLLDETFEALAQQNEINAEEFTMCLLDYPGRRIPKVRRILARKLGLKLSVMNDLIDTYRRHNTRK